MGREGVARQAVCLSFGRYRQQAGSYGSCTNLVGAGLLAMAVLLATKNSNRQARSGADDVFQYAEIDPVAHIESPGDKAPAMQKVGEIL